MTKEEYLKILGQGVERWNEWRNEHSQIKHPNLSDVDFSRNDLTEINLEGADLTGSILAGARLWKANFRDARMTDTKLMEAQCPEAIFSGSDLRWANLRAANLGGAQLQYANVSEASLGSTKLSLANLRGADLTDSYLKGAKLSYADLTGAFLSCANLIDVDFTGAKLQAAHLNAAICIRTNFSGADLEYATLARASLVEANLSDANLSNCSVYGVSAWDLRLKDTKQLNLVISRGHNSAIARYLNEASSAEPTITVDNIEVAQFIYLLLNHQKIRDVITIVGEKAVLILGRFSPERKEVLDSIADGLRNLKYLPIIFDFERVPGLDYTETIKVLAGLSRFVIADITQPKSVPQESLAIVPDFKIPFVRIIQKGEATWAMSEDLNLYDWVINEVIEYPTKTILANNIKAIVDLAENKRRHLMEKRLKNSLRTLRIEDLIANSFTEDPATST